MFFRTGFSLAVIFVLVPLVVGNPLQRPLRVLRSLSTNTNDMNLEKDCVMQGGMCVRNEICKPANVVTIHADWCPDQEQGVVCCYVPIFKEEAKTEAGRAFHIQRVEFGTRKQIASYESAEFRLGQLSIALKFRLKETAQDPPQPQELPAVATDHSAAEINAGVDFTTACESMSSES